jgi:hypothetical protein
MSDLLVFIPNIYRRWENINPSIRQDLIIEVAGELYNNRESYEYDDRDIPDAKDSLGRLWRHLINYGHINHNMYGYYDEDDCCSRCPIFDGIYKLIYKDFKKYIIGDIDHGFSEANCIINLNGNNIIDRLKPHIIRGQLR